MQSVYYSSLGAEQQVYDQAYQCFLNRSRSIPVSSPNAKDIVFHVLREHPELFYVSQQMGMATSLFRSEIIPTYLYSPQEAQQLGLRLEQTAGELIDELINDHQSEYDKVRSLHDYLKSHTEYDTVAAMSHQPNDRGCAEAHNIVGALLKHSCVCEGFAKAMKYLCDRIGIECWVVEGVGSSSVSSGPHAWNIVRINGYYHHVDVTWDNQYSDSAQMPNYGYLNLSDDEIAKDHTWNRKHYPACPTAPYNYFRVNNALVDSRAQLESMLYNSFEMEEECIMFRVVRGSRLEQEINGCISDSVTRAVGKCRYIRIRRYQYGSVPEQLTFFIKPEYEYI